MADTDKIVRSDEEIMAVRTAARVVTDKMEAEGGSASDAPEADALYEFIQWLYGWSDNSPIDSYLDLDNYA